MKKPPSCAAIYTSNATSYTDHIAPLASLFKIPLLISHEKNKELIERYYPEVDLRYMPDFEFRLKEIGEEFETLFDCDYWKPGQRAIFAFHTNREMKIVFCPHGQSDKGYHSSFLEPYSWQERVLLYGPLMQEMLSDLNLWHSIPHTAMIGNFRRNYFEKHRERLLAITHAEIFSKLKAKNRNLLFAPTWNDSEQAGTFFEHGEKLLQELPSEWNLLIKVHPDLAEHDPALYYRLSLLEEKRPNFLLIEEFPPIYPLLESVDVYLGDYSSIGYDFLSFQRPMFFLQKPHLLQARLHACGPVIDPQKGIYQSIEAGLSHAPSFKKVQEALYQKAFAPINDIQSILQALLSCP